MKQPSIKEFDAWRDSPVGMWFFDHFLRNYADESARVNGRQVGLMEETQNKEFMIFVRNAGVIQGVEFAIEADPYFEERDDTENTSSRSSDTGGDGI